MCEKINGGFKGISNEVELKDNSSLYDSCIKTVSFTELDNDKNYISKINLGELENDEE